MKPKRIAIVACLVLVAGLYAGYRHMARQDMIRCTLEWGRLAPFPEAATQFNITTEGGPFTRAFRASFTAAPNIIKAWVSASPGFGDAQLDEPEPGLRRFIIKPGAGAQWAEVQIDDRADLVKVYVYWS